MEWAENRETIVGYGQSRGTIADNRQLTEHKNRWTIAGYRQNRGT